MCILWCTELFHNVAASHIYSGNVSNPIKNLINKQWKLKDKTRKNKMKYFSITTHFLENVFWGVQQKMTLTRASITSKYSYVKQSLWKPARKKLFTLHSSALYFSAANHTLLLWNFSSIRYLNTLFCLWCEGRNYRPLNTMFPILFSVYCLIKC